MLNLNKNLCTRYVCIAQTTCTVAVNLLQTLGYVFFKVLSKCYQWLPTSGKKLTFNYCQLPNFESEKSFLMLWMHQNYSFCLRIYSKVFDASADHTLAGSGPNPSHRYLSPMLIIQGKPKNDTLWYRNFFTCYMYYI